ncbi:MAG: ribosome recycling factor [Bacteroidota bacterium]|nr:ribosome recycling factor [Bacteroidota bacterium]
MTEESKMCLDAAKDGMQNSIEHLKRELLKIRTGKASPKMLSNVMVDYYGSNTPLERVANIATPDARQITVQPWDKSMLVPIVKAIQVANLGLNPQDDGELIRIIVPELTEERRIQLVKQTKKEGENAKVSIRNERKDANDMAKDLESEGISEDDVKHLEDEIQKATNNFSKEVDVILVEKEKEIMSI